MKKTKIIEKALKLGINDRVEIVRQLLNSLPKPILNEESQSFDKIIVQRLEDYQHGVTETSTWDEVMKEYKSRNN